MELPINIVPAPVGQLVALYVRTTIPALHEDYRISLAEIEYGENRVFYMIRPVVAWGFYRDQDELWLTNNAMVAGSGGDLMFAGLEPKHLSQELRSFSDIDTDSYSVDSICTPAEVEARLAFFAEAAPGAEFVRQTAAQFTDEYRLTLP